MDWHRRVWTGQGKAARVVAMLAALLWALLPFCAAGGVPASASQWVAVPYCAAAPAETSTGDGQTAPQRHVWLYFASAKALPWAGSLVHALPAAGALLPLAPPLGARWTMPRLRQVLRADRVALPAVRGPPFEDLLPA